MQPPIGAPGTTAAQSHIRHASYYQVLYRFDKYPNGEEPVAGLTVVGGTLYGTASGGGLRGCHGRGGCGTVYTITTNGVENLLFTFTTDDGIFPKSRLIDVKGTLYGTTYQGGPGRRGTVYSIGTTGSETVLHGFSGSPDGGRPVAAVIDVKGTLYGTTTVGGMKHAGTPEPTATTTPLPVAKCCGVFYSVSTSGAERVLYKFKGGTDGDSADGGLIDVKGILYGTTSFGGASGCGCGTFYSMTTAGVERVLYRFTGGSDGKYPVGDLIDVGGILYGTTVGGGTACGSTGCGTVYTVTTSGKEKVLYRFAGRSNGAHPAAGLLDVKGTLYGTTVDGGEPQNKQATCCGTVFALTP